MATTRNPFADGERTVTGYIQASMFKPFCTQGHNGAGAVTATGATVGDQVIAINNITDHALANSSFEPVVTVNDQIQQTSASDLSAKTLTILLASQSAVVTN